MLTSQKITSASASFSTTGVLDASSAGSTGRQSSPPANAAKDTHASRQVRAGRIKKRRRDHLMSDSFHYVVSSGSGNLRRIKPSRRAPGNVAEGNRCGL